MFVVVWGVTAAVGFLAWFACLALGRMPTGFRDLLAYTLRYGAQTWGYLLLPHRPVSGRRPERTAGRPADTGEAGQRCESRTTCAGRGSPSSSGCCSRSRTSSGSCCGGSPSSSRSIVGWFATLITGRLPGALHRFLAAYVRYATHVFAFLFLVANPFPGFAGTQGTLPGRPRDRCRPERQKPLEDPVPAPRWRFPAHLLGSALTPPARARGVLRLVRRPRSSAGCPRAFAISARTSSATRHRRTPTSFLLTDSYPYSGPTDYVKPVPPWPGPLPLPSPSA